MPSLDYSLPPIDLSEPAADRIKQLLARHPIEGARLRVAVKGGGCAGLEYILRLDSGHTPYDVEYEIRGIAVVVDSKSAHYLRGSTLELTGQLIGCGFRVNNPSAERTCGCGTSFTIPTQG